ncbi:MAG TPA: endo alpha-1,4 polygalactosaminidase [Solirubrobacteraceae bacterium]|nr:endo alpha-1,4 polygalactosaminidase [Solirubrobacteraceae bacterium]
MLAATQSITVRANTAGGAPSCAVNGGKPAACAATISVAAGSSLTISAPAAATTTTSLPTDTSPPTISGTPQVGDTLTANPGSWTGSPTFTYAWSDGTTATTDTLAAGDEGKTITVTVTATNSGGSVPATSAAVGPVTAPSGSGGSGGGGGGGGTGYTKPPSDATWYWQIGGGTLPTYSAAYPAPGSANIWDTDLFADSNVSGGIPTGPSPVVQGIHAAGHYAICYVEAGANQVGFPDDSDFASADYTDPGHNTQLQGYPGENYLDLAGFSGWSARSPSVFPDTTPSNDASNDVSAAQNIAAGLAQRFAWCKREGQDAVEADDLDGYTNSNGWGLTQQDAVGFEAWIAYTVHNDGLAWFMKNDAGDAQAAVNDGADGLIIEECNYYDDPCGSATQPGDATPFLKAGLPVLNAEYTQDGETTAKFCPTDNADGIYGALFDVNLAGGTYEPCWNSAGGL